MNNDNEMVHVPRYLLETLRPDGYFHRVYELVQASALSLREAYEAIESEREAHFIPPNYDSYESFRSAKSQYFRTKLVRITC